MLTDGTDAQQSLVHHKGSFECQWLGNVDMHIHAICNKNKPGGSRVKNIFTNC